MIYIINGISFETRSPAFLAKPSLELCAAAYHRNQRRIADFVYENLKADHPGLARRGLERKLDLPSIDPQSMTVRFGGPALGLERGFSFRASDDFRLLRDFRMDSITGAVCVDGGDMT